MNIITGEKIQELADIYISTDFNYNPKIARQKHKHKYLQNINTDYDNPKIIYTYTHDIILFNQKLNFFKNDFILITHNSDHNITNNEIVNNILNHPKLIKWFAQNICYKHPKLEYLPIGIPNSQWRHNNEHFYLNNDFKNIKKTKKIYFNFNIATNSNQRQKCYDQLKNKIEFLPNIDSYENLKRLSQYQFCICPDGNGIDTHRHWEALYLKCIPIVLKNQFNEILSKDFNMIRLDSWTDLDINKLNYEDFIFDDEYYKKLSIDYIKEKILSYINININI
jgi:hypothetical protein